MSDKKICLVCDRDSNLVPLVKIHFKEKKHYICSEHLPVLIHKPHELADKLPHADELTGLDDAD